MSTAAAASPRGRDIFAAKWDNFLRFLQAHGVNVNEALVPASDAFENAFAVYIELPSDLQARLLACDLTRQEIQSLLAGTPVSTPATTLLASLDAAAFDKLLLYAQLFARCCKAELPS